MLRQTWNFIRQHPLTRERPVSAIWRFFHYQFLVRTRKTAVMPWFGEARFVVARGMTGASGNIYCGLHEVADMAFFMHVLREGDLFIDIGANIGSYTLLASKICKADAVTFEPDPMTFSRLQLNIAENGLASKVEAHCIALMDRPGHVSFSEGLDTTNHVIDGEGGQVVRCERLDDVLATRAPVAIKIDVEGAELLVLQGSENVLSSPSLLAVEAEGWNLGVNELLTEAGFQQVYYDPFKRELTSKPGNLSGGNALYVRDLNRVRALIAQSPYRRVLPGVRI